MAANHRKGSYGQTIRVNIGLDMSQFTGQTGRNITAVLSAASGTYSQEFNFDSSTLFIGNSTVFSSTEGIGFASGQWVYYQPATAQALVTADTHYTHIRASATGQFFITPTASFEVDV